MDEINEKAIKDIINYYDRLKDEESESPAGEDEPPAELQERVPVLVELIEEKVSAADEESSDADEPDEETSEDTGGDSQADASRESDVTKDEKDGEEGSEDEEPLEPESESENKSESKSDEAQESEKSTRKKETLARGEGKITVIDSLTDYEEDEDYHFRKKQIAAISIITLLIASAVVLFVTVDTGIIGTYKQNFSKNASIVFSKMGIELPSKSSDDTQTEEGDVKEAEKYKVSADSTVTVPLEKAGSSEFSIYKSGIVCANSNFLALIDNSRNTVWENTTTIVSPILKTAGNYILIAEKNGKKICLYNDRKLVYEVDTDDNILTCNLSANGDVVAITDKSSYKGAVVVFNKEGNQIFAWSSGSDNIISADISASSRRVAVALLNTDEQVKSMVQFFDINKTESYAQVIFEDTILFNIDFTGDTIDAFGDNCIAGITSSGSLIYDKRFENAEFVHYAVDEKGNKILLFDNSNIPLINIYNSSAVLKYQLSSDELPDFVDIYGNYIIYNNGRDIIYGRPGSSRLAKFTASMDIKDLKMLDKDEFFVVYSNSIEIVGM